MAGVGTDGGCLCGEGCDQLAGKGTRPARVEQVGNAIVAMSAIDLLCIGKTKSPATQARCVCAVAPNALSVERTVALFCADCWPAEAVSTFILSACWCKQQVNQTYCTLITLTERASECLSLNGSINKAKAQRDDAACQNVFRRRERTENEWTRIERPIDC